MLIPRPTHAIVRSVEATKDTLLSALGGYVEHCRPGELARRDAEYLRCLADDIDSKLDADQTASGPR